MAESRSVATRRGALMGGDTEELSGEVDMFYILTQGVVREVCAFAKIKLYKTSASYLGRSYHNL